MMSANMEGTEIYNALGVVFSQSPKKNYPRILFLLTDGGICNLSSVLTLIKSNNSKNLIFTIGVGSGCSPDLITSAASFGRGKYEFVQDNEDLTGKVISLLDAAMTPCCDDFTLSGDQFDKLVEAITPNPNKIPYLLRDQAVTFFVHIRSGLADF
jgi:hypothetical protein